MVAQVIEIWPYYQIVRAQTDPVLDNETRKILRDFEIQIDHLIPTRRSKLGVIKNKPRCIVNFAVKIKESEKRDRYFKFTKELKNLWNMKVTVISIIIGALGTVP